MVVGRCLARGLGLRERSFQRHDRCGPLVRTVEAGQCQQAADVLLVTGSERLHARLGADVVLAVRQAEPALQQKGDVGLLAVDARFHRQAKQVGRSVDAPVERVDIGPETAAQEPGQRRLVRHLIDAVQERLEWRDAPGFDGGLVQVGRAEVGDLARDGSHRLGAGVVQQSQDLLAGELTDLAPRVPALLACRDLGGPEPAAVGIGKEVVAGLDARVHAGFEVRMWLVGRLRGCYSPGAPDQHRGEQHAAEGWDSRHERDLRTGRSPS